MSTFDKAFVDQVRERNDIVSVVGDYVALKKAGASFKGLCPFHGEKTPSFHVHPDRQFFKCFGCQTGGDVLTFVREINGYSFVEAVRHLAERAGLEVPERSADYRSGAAPRAGRASRAVRDGFYAINRIAQRFYVETLDAMEGTRCREYLRQRQIDRETVERFGLGCAPDRWDGLVTALREANCDLSAAESLGLIIARPGGGGHYDRFRNRLMFPIRSVPGEVLGFSGRTLATEGEPAKYVNSPESALYQKGDNVYGLYEARQALRKLKRGILVEGQVDLLRLAQLGHEEVVAPLGTALTAAQCRLLKRFAPQVVALYDGDGAGREAARKAAQLALAEGLVLRVASLPDGQDPDSFARERGREALDEVLEAAVPAWEFLVGRALTETDALSSVQGQRLAIEQLAPVLCELASAEERVIFERGLAETLRMDERVLRNLVNSTRRRAPQPREPEGVAQLIEAPVSVTELKLLELLVLTPEARARYLGHDIETLVSDPRVREAARAITTLADDDAGVGTSAADVGAVLDAVPPGLVRDQLMRRLTEAPAPTDGALAFEDLFKQLRCDAIKRKLETLRLDERRAWLSRDDETALLLGLEKTKLERQLEGLRAFRD